MEAYERHLNRGFIGYRKSVTEAGQFAALEWSGQGSMLQDLLGREYIDCLGGYGIFSSGVNHPKILRAVASQMERMALNSQELLEPWRAGLARLLAMVTPGELGNAFFINNGTDAIEGAIKLARLYTRRNLFVSTLGGFHGKSMGSLSLMGKASFREPFAGGLQDVRFVPYGDADALEAELSKAAQVGTPVAGFVVEPVQGEAGGVVPSAGLSAARPRAVHPGTARCSSPTRSRPAWAAPATLWGVDHTDTVPDIMCLGKSIGGGIMPLSAFISTPEIWEVLIPNPIIHSTTFGGNPMACAAGIAAIQVTLEEDLPGPGGRQGRVSAARAGRARGPSIRRCSPTAHGKGLLIGMEFPTDETGFRCAAGLFKRGVLVAGTYSKARTIRIEPALGISMELLGEMLTRLEDTFCEVAKGDVTDASTSVHPERSEGSHSATARREFLRSRCRSLDEDRRCYSPLLLRFFFFHRVRPADRHPAPELHVALIAVDVALGEFVHADLEVQHRRDREDSGGQRAHPPRSRGGSARCPRSWRDPRSPRRMSCPALSPISPPRSSVWFSPERQRMGARALEVGPVHLVDVVVDAKTRALTGRRTRPCRRTPRY